MKRIITITDDLGGSGAADSVAFSFGGVDYQVDLNKRNTETFERHMKRWIDVARVLGHREVRDLSEVREWAAEQGIQLASRGRIPQHVLDAFEAAS